MTRSYHGGNLHQAASQYDIPLSDWIDLSTGINPVAYPIPDIEASVFQRLPYPSDAFESAILRYYGAEGLACNGSQPVIEALPSVLPDYTVLLPNGGYQEHRRSWSQHTQSLSFYPAECLDQAKRAIEQALATGEPFHLVLINPNNPSGLMFSCEQIFQFAKQMPQGGCVILDEAFIDLNPTQSVLSDYDRFTQMDNLLVLRSFGKFFGLAGVRLGFFFGPKRYQATLRSMMGPWAVNGPAQWLAEQALLDDHWQTKARIRIAENATFMKNAFQPVLEAHSGQWLTDQGLFLSAKLTRESAHKIYTQLAKMGVLIRLIDHDEWQPVDGTSYLQEDALLRIGLVDAQQEAMRERIVKAFSALINA
jgi:cobalamin biosynthetic protein CobC